MKKPDRTKIKTVKSLAAAFISTEFLKSLVALKYIVVDTKNSSFRKPESPNLNAYQAESVTVKYYFNYIFDCP